MSMHCSNCGIANVETARFCRDCGAKLQLPLNTDRGDSNSRSDDPIENQEDKQNAEDPLIGRTIESKYRIDSLIGVGGMGAVYRATRILIGDEVAIKIMHSDRAGDPRAAERFRREARAAARLKHPNAVSIHDVGVSGDGLQYLVMELVEGNSLRDIVAKYGKLGAPLVVDVTWQICAALDEAHRQHIIHRDIKPDNVILSPTETGVRVKVLDFGIAKLRDEKATNLTQTGSVMGTPHYMSPEQCLGEELDCRADIYSIGILVYEMLCGRVPFNSPVSTAVVVQHVNQPPPPMRAINALVSPKVESAVMHALEKQRESRPQSAGAFAQELITAVSESPSKYEPSFGEARLPTPQRNLVVESSGKHDEVAQTVHLKNRSGSTASVTRGRATAGSGQVDTPVMNRSQARIYAYLGIATAILGTILGLVAWRLSDDGTGKPNSGADIESSRSGGTSNNSSVVAQAERTTPPPDMAYVVGGTFEMGSNDEDVDSRPRHSVTLKPFFIDIHEVTCAEYKKFIDASGRVAPSSWSNRTYPSGTDKRPVTNVSWEDAVAYARWLGKRLPTEEEWEFAARGPKGLIYPWGNAWLPGCANADAEGLAHQGLVDVGTYDCGSPFGAVDMVGNAFEWTADDWRPYPGGTLMKPMKVDEKVIRGGSWTTDRKFATAIFRSAIPGPASKTGFRCVKDVP